MTPIKILFVCLGNICRSPAAEGAFQNLIYQRNLENFFIIDSAGTAGYHDGELSDLRTRKTAQNRGIDLTHVSRSLKLSDYNYFDYILAMDQANFREIVSRLKNAEQISKIHLFRSFEGKGDPLEVPDPYYKDDSFFEKVQDIVEIASIALLEFLIKKHGLKTEAKNG